MSEDASFSQGPRPGEPFPDFDLPTIDGRRLRKHDLEGRPSVLIFGSVT